MEICSILHNLWCLAYNIKKIQNFMIGFNIFLTTTNANLFKLTKKANMNMNIFGEQKKANTNTNIFGLTKKGNYEYQSTYLQYHSTHLQYHRTHL